jgi:hypothetical protein
MNRLSETEGVTVTTDTLRYSMPFGRIDGILWFNV